jgi:hypothetical protein
LPSSQLKKPAGFLMTRSEKTFLILGSSLKNMKKSLILPLVLVGLAFGSCKKAYICNCVTTDQVKNPSGTDIYKYSNRSTIYSEKMTKKQAEATCSHEEEAIHSSYENWWTSNGNRPDPNFTTSTECSLN